MTKYRLYTSDVAKGITDFDDQTYIIIHRSYITEHCIIIDTSSYYKPFIIAYKVEYHEYSSIDWAQGEYFDNFESAYIFLRKKEIIALESKENNTAPG